MTKNIAKVESRSSLPPRREPYWHRLEAGCYIGFRKMSKDAPGTWLARCRNMSTGKQDHSPLGEFIHAPAHLRFDLAAKAAREWFGHMDRGGRNTAATVEDACAAYVKHLEDSDRCDTALDAKKRFARWVDGTPFGHTKLQKLTRRETATWRATVAKTPKKTQSNAADQNVSRSPGTVNRDMTAVRAALNLALENGDATDDSAWRTALRPTKDADGRRDIYLDIEQRRQLVANAASDLAAFLRALSEVPLRPGAMAKLRVSSFDVRLSTLKIGKDKNGGDRTITLPPNTASIFASLSKDKLADAPLLARADGQAWNKDSWKGPIKDAVRGGGLPGNSTAYSLRHSTITDLIVLHKLDTLSVARLSGTSLAMIEKHYGHLLGEHAARALASLSI